MVEVVLLVTALIKLGNCGSQLSQWQAKRRRLEPKVKTPYVRGVRGRSTNGFGSLTVPCPHHYLIPIIPSIYSIVKGGQASSFDSRKEVANE
ncbi:hypothetical protein EEL31_03515 [Brevibacillus laterosporus]|uniref:Uncharacterized protein n=1 Tax=Brevibacillus laterosporus TaxID=1465 RepID=A0A518V9V7_BRELA|nr:hypothetical protein EEL30_16645 [Brevibacillus laterosporus]TPG73441.1 hypothetical protein EEL31_03515 [Brevibacillus laterosporus]